MFNTRTFRQTLIACAVAALAGTALAQQPAPATPAAPAAAAAAAAQTVRPGDLLTPQERDAFRQQMQQAATPEDRQKIRDAHRAVIEQRAQEKGVTLAQPYGGARGPGAQGGQGWHRHGPGGQGPNAGQRGASPDQRGPYAQLFTQAERDQFRDRMHSAQTVEERTQLRNEMHATAETRAKEKGITLPQPGQGRHGPGSGPGRGYGPGYGPGPNRGPAQSTTPPAS